MFNRVERSKGQYFKATGNGTDNYLAAPGDRATPAWATEKIK
jgi:hypothetical protein